MINWYRTGKDPAREMIRLTTYLGHTDPDNTFWIWKPCRSCLIWQ